MLALPLCAAAVPAYPGLIEQTLADGTVVNIRIHGDEYFNYITDEEGYLLKYEGEKLAYDLSDGVRRMATDEVVEALRMENMSTARYKAKSNDTMQRMAALDTQGRTTFCTTGDVHFLVLMVQYTDTKFSSADPKAAMEAKLNEEGYNQFGAIGSMRDYFMQTSNGKFRPTFDVSDVIDLDHDRAYYTGNGRHENVTELVKEAVAKADPTIDFSKYDYTGDGEVDAVIFYYAGYGQADTPDTDAIWPHQSRLYPSDEIEVDGKKVAVYCFFNELNGGAHYTKKDLYPDGIGTAVHEFSHVMGLPDLYDPNYKVSATPGKWSVMDMGPYNGDGYIPPMMSAYERWCMNWLDYEDIADNTHYDLETLHKSQRALKIPVYRTNGTIYANEYFLLESRNKEGYDSELPGEGLLIWHVDYNKSRWVANGVNSILGERRCHLVTADGSANPNLGNNTTSSANAAWPYGVNTYLTPDTEITLNTNNILAASKTGQSYIINIAYDADKDISSFDYNTITATPDVTTVLKHASRVPDANGNPTNVIRLEWEPVPGADSYELTVWRVGSNGKINYENRLDNMNIGNVYYYDLPSFTSTKMALEYHAQVRVVKPIPSAVPSNELTFVGNDLVTSGVNGIEADEEVVIRGLKGAIEAPEGAEVYTISGQRTSAEGLTPGMYLVRYNGKTVKAIVK